MEDSQPDTQDVAQETPVDGVFRPPSIKPEQIINGISYPHYSELPAALGPEKSVECVLGVDEAGRGPVLGPMVYGVFYLPKSLHKSLLADTHKFDDSKVLTPAVRSQLMEKLCTSDSDLYANCGWATDVMSARVISAGMLKSTGMYNLNAQAMDSTIELIKGVLARGVNVTEIYVDTIGSPAIYQKKLERIFPTAMVTVAKKADSLYPCVSAASVCAKVTRDAALEVCYEDYAAGGMTSSEGWGSGYPSDGRTSTWLKSNMDPVFGWGTECRFSWGTVKELFDAKNRGFKVDWPAHDDDNSGMKMTDFFTLPADSADDGGEHNELTNWFGKPVSEELF